MNKTGKIVMRRCAACCLPVLFWISSLLAQCGLHELGYIFVLPFFDNGNWEATESQSQISNSKDFLCTNKPVRFEASKAASRGTVVYTTSDEKWMMFNAPLDTSDCFCCRPRITFEVPAAEVTGPADLSVVASLPFHIMNRGSVDNDTVYIVAATAGDRVYCMHMSALSGKIGAVDTITVTKTGEQTIGGIWGESDNNGDAGIWIGGSNGLLTLLSFSDNQWGSQQAVSIDNSETVSCVGGGFVGTASGKVYQRSGNTCSLVNSSATAALRYISSECAVGDAGTILVNRNGTWQKYSSGSTNYRYAHLTATSDSSAIELLDATWNYTLRNLYDSPSTITELLPERFADSIKENGIIVFDDNFGIETLTIKYDDEDDNRAVPSIVIKNSGGSRTMENGSLLPHNKSAIIDTAAAYFNDTKVDIILEKEKVSLEAIAKKGEKDENCGFLVWLSSTYKNTISWQKYDSLIISISDSTVKVFNDCSLSVVTSKQTISYPSSKEPVLWQVKGHVYINSNSASNIFRVSLVNAAGRRLWQRNLKGVTASGSIVSSKLPQGIHFLRIEYRDGRVTTKRIAVVGR